MFFPSDPKQSQDLVFKFKLSHRSFACWQADLCEFEGNGMVADNCHSSKAHKFVKFRSNFNYFVLEIK